MDITTPIWKLEEIVFSVWYFLTGKERPALRKALFIPYFIIQFVGFFLIEYWLWRGLLLIWGTIVAILHWYDWGKKQDDYKNSAEVKTKATYFYLDLFSFVFYFTPIGLTKAYAFYAVSSTIFAFDYFIMWADHMDKNNPRKRHESLPERLAKVFAAFKPTIDGV